MSLNSKFGALLLLMSFDFFTLALYGGAKLVAPTAVAPTPTDLPGEHPGRRWSPALLRLPFLSLNLGRGVGPRR
jgi:hypothetical protein